MLVANQAPEAIPFPSEVWEGAHVKVRMVSKSAMEAARRQYGENAAKQLREATAGMSADELDDWLKAIRKQAQEDNKDSGEGLDPDATSDKRSSGSASRIDPVEGPTFEQWEPGMLGADVYLIVKGAFAGVVCNDQHGEEQEVGIEPDTDLQEQLTEPAFDFIAKCATWKNRPRPLGMKS